MLPPNLRPISVDDHIIEPPNVWVDRLPRKWQDVGPRIVEVEDASGKNDGQARQAWRWEGRIYKNVGLNAVAGRPRRTWGLDPVRYDEMIPGCYDVKARVTDMDKDGVQASLNFPTFPRFAGTLFLEGEDKDLALACVQAYNDWHIDEWCGYAPDRFIPMVILPLWDADLAAAEIRRTHDRGALAITFPEMLSSLGLPSIHTDYWDPVFAAAQELGMPLSMHFGTSATVPMPSSDSPIPVSFALYGCNSMYATADLLFSKILQRFPGTKVSLAEGGTGWVPWLLERLDYTWDRHRHYTDIPQDTPPSETFKKNIWVCHIEDATGVELRSEIGVDKMMWECDYPHSDSLWPKSQESLLKTLADVPTTEVQAIVEDNARKLFNFDADLRKVG